MTFVITKSCIGTCDSACVDACPCDCIMGPIPIAQLRAIPAADRGRQFPGVQLFINPDDCIDCGACMDECPVAAIYPDDSVPANHREDIERNARFFRDRR